jgi:hypothetical protein
MDHAAGALVYPIMLADQLNTAAENHLPPTSTNLMQTQ